MLKQVVDWIKTLKEKCKEFIASKALDCLTIIVDLWCRGCSWISKLLTRIQGCWKKVAYLMNVLEDGIDAVLIASGFSKNNVHKQKNFDEEARDEIKLQGEEELDYERCSETEEEQFNVEEDDAAAKEVDIDEEFEYHNEAEEELKSHQKEGSKKQDNKAAWRELRFRFERSAESVVDAFKNLGIE